LSYQTSVVGGSVGGRGNKSWFSAIQQKSPLSVTRALKTDSFSGPSVYKRNGSAISKLPCSAMRYPHLWLAIELDRKHIIELKILICLLRY